MTDIAAIQVKALEATKACSPLIETTIGIDPDTGLDNGGEVECHKCHGTGRVSILDPDDEFGLRVECPNAAKDPIWHDRIALEFEGMNCAGCGIVPSKGIYWTPNDDMAAWMRALEMIDDVITIRLHHDRGLWYCQLKGKKINNGVIRDTFELAFYTAVAEAIDAIQDGLANES